MSIHLSFLFCIFSFITFSNSLRASEVQLAHVYKQQDISDYLVSEKYDGIRAVWRDGQLRSRSGKRINAPAWFTEGFPDIWLDGELWLGRNKFESLSSVVSKHEPVDGEWRKVHYMVFDAPGIAGPFQQRVLHYTTLIKNLGIEHLNAVEQRRFINESEFNHWYQALLDQGAEGLMLHRADAHFIAGRTHHLLKLKPYRDAEAVVLKHYPGKGKYQNMMGSVLVSWLSESGETRNFKLGSGFTDEDRVKPPAIGSTVSFKYYGLTNTGLPRFATYWRKRK
ncbi:DNA ligase [Agaribacterium sp. ZY112]|uniref:DNA ligase n=1 Tax=Agaribacterium sp. ZY112 TaxID=3233574 RepID=UPI0035263AE4